jgi:hypothetical protein
LVVFSDQSTLLHSPTCIHCGGCLSQDGQPTLVEVTTPFSNGCLGSHIDEERSELRYVLRIAKPCESSNFRTHIAVPVLPGACLLECQRTLFVPPLLYLYMTLTVVNGGWWVRCMSRPRCNGSMTIALPNSRFDSSCTVSPPFGGVWSEVVKTIPLTIHRPWVHGCVTR